MSDCWSVCHNYLKALEVTLPWSYQSNRSRRFSLTLLPSLLFVIPQNVNCVLNKTLKSLNWAKDSSCFLTMPEYCICGGPACVGLARTIDPRRPLSGGKRSCACACVCVCVWCCQPAIHTITVHKPSSWLIQ